MEYTNDEEEQTRPGLTPEEFLAERKRRMRRNSWWGITIGTITIALMSLGILYLLSIPEFQFDEDGNRRTFFSLLFGNLFVLLGLFFVGAGLWGLYEARRLTVEDLIPSPEAVEFLRQAEGTTPLYSYIILGCLVSVFVVQLVTAGDDGARRFPSVDTAGLVKPAVWEQGQYWRLLTSGVLHAGFLHIYFNAQAFFGFATLIEVLSDRARMAIVFVLAIIGGGLLSTLNYTNIPSVGASGGIMGLIGYLAIYGYRRKRQLPPDFLRNMLVNIGFIAAIGIFGYQVIDNLGHLGGLIVGLAYGFFTVPREISDNPRSMGAVTEGAGMIATGIVVFFSILTILLISGRIAF